MMRPRLLLFLCGTLAVVAMVLTQQSPVNAANPSADLDQCRNGDQLNPVPCTGAAWVNGNAGASNAHWNEGESIAYRMRFSNLATGVGNPHTLIIEWDTTQSGKHALDYITSVDRSVVADPCSGVAGCTLTHFLPIPPDPAVQAPPGGTGTLADSNAAGRWNQQMRLYNAGAGAQILSMTPYALSGTYAGSSSTRLTITFVTNTANPVLAWGGHIATRADWGTNNSAIAINGSPYHMRLISLDGAGGNQDRSLSSAAAIFPAMLTIIKDVQTTNGGAATSTDSFNFTANSPDIPGTSPAVKEVPSPFPLIDDGTQNPETTPNSATFSLVLFGSNNAVTVSEDAYSKYTQSLSCQEASGGLGSTSNTTVTQSTRTANVIAEEGEIITCIYVNKVRAATLTLKKHVVNDNGGTKTAADFSLHVKTSVNGQMVDITATPGSPHAGSESGVTYTLDAGTYTVSEESPISLNYTQLTGFGTNCDTSGNVTLGPGDNKECTITNDDNAASLTIVKNVVNDGGGSKTVADFGITSTATGLGGSLIFDAGVVNGSTTTYTATKITGLSAGTSYTLHESNVSGYTEGSWSCTTGGTVGNSGNFSTATVTLALGADVTCTITNNDANNSGSTTQGVILNDSASITSIGPVAGTTYQVTFRLYLDNQAIPTCTTSPIYTAVRNLTLIDIGDPVLKNGTASTKDPAPAGTPDTGSKEVTQSGKYYWTIQMASDANNNGVTENCGKEVTNLTINDSAKP
jgi:prealbumin domain-containing protein